MEWMLVMHAAKKGRGSALAMGLAATRRSQRLLLETAVAEPAAAMALTIFVVLVVVECWRWCWWWRRWVVPYHVQSAPIAMSTNIK